MCKGMTVSSVNRVVDKKRIIKKKWRNQEEERHEGLLTKKSPQNLTYISVPWPGYCFLCMNGVPAPDQGVSLRA
jgi:hypothetical protein